MEARLDFTSVYNVEGTRIEGESACSFKNISPQGQIILDHRNFGLSPKASGLCHWITKKSLMPNSKCANVDIEILVRVYRVSWKLDAGRS